MTDIKEETISVMLETITELANASASQVKVNASLIEGLEIANKRIDLLMEEAKR